MKAHILMRRMALAVSAMAITLPMMAHATQIRYMHQLGPKTQKAVSALMDNSLMGGAGQPALHTVALFNRGELLVSPTNNKMRMNALSAGTLVQVVESGACDLLTADSNRGVCLVAENGQVMNIGVRHNEDGTRSIVQGTFQAVYEKRQVKTKSGKVKTVEVSILSKISDLLTKGTKGTSIIYSSAAGPMKNVIVKDRNPIADVEPVKVDVVTDQKTGDSSIGICAIEAKMEVKSFHLGVGWTDAVGRGVITCKHFSGRVEKLPVKLVSEARGAGIGFDMGSETELVASGLGLTTAGIKGFLGNYAVTTAGGQLGVGLDVGLALTADSSGLVIPAGLRGKAGLGLGAAADAGRLTITEDDGVAPEFPAHEVIQEWPNKG